MASVVAFGSRRVCRPGMRLPRSFASVTYPSKLFIGNEWRDATAGGTFPVTNPYTTETIVNCAKATAADVDVAVKLAYEAQYGGAWGIGITGAKRSGMLRHMGARLRERREEFAKAETADIGKPIVESRADMDACADMFDYFGGLAAELDEPRAVDTRDGDLEGRILQEPAGVIAAVTPWNYPLLQSVAKVAPALAAGCATVLKPSASAPLTSLMLGELALDAGLPAGAFAVIAGRAGEVGDPLIGHPLVDRVSYTGSGKVGKGIMSIAAQHLRQTTMELGGKGSIVLFDDYTNLDAAVDWVMCGNFLNTGQVCSSTPRVLVQEKIREAFLAKLLKKTEAIRIGDPMLEETQMGPMVSEAQLKGVLAYVERAENGEGTLLCGGSKAKIPNKGAFIAPVVVIDPPEDSSIWQEEIFGPVLALRSFSTEEEALRMANDTEFGLSNAVLSGDAARCDRMARKLRSGIVWINHNQSLPVSIPFGGFKKSGFGKEYGVEGLNEFLQAKSIVRCDAGYTWGWYA